MWQSDARKFGAKTFCYAKAVNENISQFCYKGEHSSFNLIQFWKDMIDISRNIRWTSLTFERLDSEDDRVTFKTIVQVICWNY